MVMTDKRIPAPRFPPPPRPVELGHVIIDAAEDGSGATVLFPFDAATVERFRAAFPRARWREDRSAWFVPGKTAPRRAWRWLDKELGSLGGFEDERGRDAFSFEPIDSPYLSAEGALIVRTPYSRQVVDALRAVPFARWDREQRAWLVPFRSYEDLRAHWPQIEAAARRAEPAERARRRGLPPSAEQMLAQGRERERRKRRYPVAADEPPPQRPVMTAIGPVVMTGNDGELVDTTAVAALYDHLGEGMAYVWISWRKPTLDELIRTWPARRAPLEEERRRGWWQPTLEELRGARRRARSAERAAETRRLRSAGENVG